MRAGEHLLDDLAAAVLDGSAVDWAAAESDAGEADRPAVSYLRLVESIASLHRDALPIETFPPPSSAAALAPPDHWGHLRLLEPVGRGAYGEVFRAWDTRLDREVALKLLPATPSTGAQEATSIIREGRLLAKVRHPNVVTIHGAEQIGDRVGLWMEFVRGATLEELLKQGTTFREADVIGIGVELCRAVSAVHAAGLLHRDIKAQNVTRDEAGRVVLMDFGTGKELADHSSSDLAGTPLYLAPEIFAGKPATVQSDVYSLGVLLFRLVTGTYPVRGRSARDLRAAHERGERVTVRAARPAVGASLARVIDQAIDPLPERRPQTAAALGESLLKVQQQSRRKPLLFATGLAAVAVAGVTTWALASGRIFGPPQAVTASPTLGPPSSAAQPPTTAPPADTTPPAADAPVTETPKAPPAVVAPARARAPGVRLSIQVTPIANASGRTSDAWLSATLAEMLLREFRGSESFRWIPGAVALAKAQLGQALITEGSHNVRPMIPADIIVSGEFNALGQPGALRLSVKLEDVAGGRAVTTLTETGATTDLGGLVSRVGTRARAALGAPALTESQAKALAVSQPANAEAARAYAEGLSKVASDWVESMEATIAADPRFAPAYAALAEGFIFRKDPDKAKATAARAAALAVDFPREERKLIEIRAQVVDGGIKNADAREELFRQLYGLFPDTLHYGFEVARGQRRAQQFREGLATVDVVRQLPGASEDLGLTQLEGQLARFAKDYARAGKAYEKAAGIAMAMGDTGTLGAIRGDQASMARTLGDPLRALAHAEEAVRLFAPRHTVVFSVGTTIEAIIRDQGGFDWTRNAYDLLIANAKTQGNRSAEQYLRFSRANLLLDHGDLSGAQAALEALMRDAGTERPHGAGTSLALAAALYRQGQLVSSEQALQDALAQAAKSQDPFDESLARHRLAQILLERGDVTLARQQADRGVDAARERLHTPRAHEAAALNAFARVLYARSEIDATRQAIDEAAAITKTTSIRHAAFDVAITRAILALAEGRVSDGRALAGQAIGLARRDFRPDDEAAGEGVLALAWLAEGNLTDAQRAIARLEPRLRVTQDRLLRLTGGIAAARVLAASNVPANVAAAKQQLATLGGDATGLGAVATSFEARLALGEIEIATGDVAAGRARLAALEKDATAKGFVNVAKRAAAATK